MVKQCQTCAKQNTQSWEPMLPTKLPAYPWQRVASDLFTLKGVNYLVVVDYFSRFPEVKTLTTTTSEKIILSLKEVFSHHGIPETLVTDNGPQFTSQEFIDFAKSYGFNHTTSSPHFPQSNGQAERTVQTVKRLLQDSADPYLALLSYRTTPFPWCGLSPAELSMGRRIHTNLPQVENLLIPKWEYLKVFQNKMSSLRTNKRKTMTVATG